MKEWKNTLVLIQWKKLYVFVSPYLNISATRNVHKQLQLKTAIRKTHMVSLFRHVKCRNVFFFYESVPNIDTNPAAVKQYALATIDE